MPTRRLRGALLRAALHRPTAVAAGMALLAPAAALTLGEFRWESWVTDGVALVAGGTGAALLLTGLAGRRPDWIDPEEPID